MQGRRLSSQRGTAMVEFALIVPLYFMLMFGFVQFALLFFVYCNATYANQVAIRYAVVHGVVSGTPCTNAILTNIVTPLLWGANKASVTVATTWSPDNSTGSTVTIKVTLGFNTMIPFASLSTFPIGTSAQGTILY
jgi:Flp pilus assembly protein TadG